MKDISTTQTRDNIGRVMARLAETAPAMARFRAGMPDDRLREPLGPGERSLTEDMAHMVNVDALGSGSIYLALLLNTPLFPPIHAERDLGLLLRHDLMPFDDLLAYFTFRRQVLLRVLAGLTDAQWSRAIREEGKARQESVYWRARGLAHHEQSHLTDLARKLPPTA